MATTIIFFLGFCFFTFVGQGGYLVAGDAGQKISVSYVDKKLQNFLNRQYEDRVFRTKKVSLGLEKACVSDAINLVGMSAGIDFSIDPDVEGEVEKIDLSDVELGQALQVLLKRNVPELALIREGDLFRITYLRRARKLFVAYEQKELLSLVARLKEMVWNQTNKDELKSVLQKLVAREISSHDRLIIKPSAVRDPFYTPSEADIAKTKLKPFSDKFFQRKELAQAKPKLVGTVGCNGANQALISVCGKTGLAAVGMRVGGYKVVAIKSDLVIVDKKGEGRSSWLLG